MSRQAPYNKDAEQAVLGAMCLSKSAINLAKERLTSDDFYLPNHQVIYSVIIDMVDAMLPVDIVTLTSELEKRSLISSIGGLDYLASLVSYVSSSANVEFHIGIVEEKSLLRKLITTSENIINNVYNFEGDVVDLLDDSEKNILQVVKNRRSSEFKSIGSVVNELNDKLLELSKNGSKITGEPSDFSQLDAMTNGLNPNELIILAARPAMGKTAFALNIAQNVALRGNKAVAVFSLEMGAEQLVSRMLSSVGKVESMKLRNAQLSDSEWDLVRNAMVKLNKSRLYLDDTPGIKVSDIRAKCRRLCAKEDVGLIVIDYLQLIQGSSKNGQNRQQEVSEISRMLKLMALELKVPVIALSQLSRAVESREDKRPMMSDLRESGSIEQDADIVMFLYRDDYYNQEAASGDVSEVEVIIGKNRHGSTGTAKVAFAKKFSLFANISS